MHKRIKEDDRYELFDRLDETYREMNLLIAEIASTSIVDKDILEELTTRQDYLAIVFARFHDAIASLSPIASY